MLALLYLASGAFVAPPAGAATVQTMGAPVALRACAASAESNALVNSLQRVSEQKGEIVVVKYGGHAMTNDERAAEFAADIALLQSLGVHPVVVHGGGPQINQMLERLEVTSNFVNGLRVTDEKVMEVVEMVLCGSLNKKIASSINAAGGRAVGLSGKDDALVRATQKNPDLGLVGVPGEVNAELLLMLLEEGVVPVIAPVATGEEGESYNVNADTMAGTIAMALGAGELLLLTDVTGVLDDNKQLLPELTTKEAQQLTEDGTATGGMIPKLATAIDAVEGGVQSAVIMDGRVPHCALAHLFGAEPIGTSVSDE